MLVETNIAGGAHLGGTYAEQVFHAPGMKLVVYTARDVVLDESGFREHPLRVLPWSGALCVLSGRGLAYRGDRAFSLRPGDVVTTRHSNELRFRMDGRDEPFRAVAICFENGHDPPITGGLAHGSLHASERRALERIVPGLYDPAPGERSDAIVCAVRDVFRAGGLPLAPLDPLALARMAMIDRREGAAFAGIGALLNDLESKPMLTDMKALTGLSARHFQRNMAALQARFDIVSWRRVVAAWRTLSACALLSTADGTTERVARIVGYGSSVALCHAFRRANLPPPGAMRTLSR